MKINKAQTDLLKSFKCERLTENADAKRCALQIKNSRGKQLIGYLQERGDEEELKGITAYYIIRNNENLPLAFFSLKCGLLYSPSMIDYAENEAELQQRLIEALDHGRVEGDPNSTAFFNIVEELAVKRNCSLDEMIKILKSQAEVRKKQAIVYKTQYHDDEKTEAEKPIYRVHVTYPAIEIVHFCTNENAKEYWTSLKFGHPIGEVLFWWFIIPRLREVQQIAGCQYAYLFAADATEDRTLINYYNVALKFVQPQGIGTIKPQYDFCCEFLIQEITELIAFQKEYFNNFNLDEDADIV